MPLDLHVLSLPLAFILSQDQTLLCIKVLSISLYLAVCPARIDRYIYFPCTALSSIYFSKNSSLPINCLTFKLPACQPAYLLSPKNRCRFWWRKGNAFFFSPISLAKKTANCWCSRIPCPFTDRTCLLAFQRSAPFFTKAAAKVLPFYSPPNFFHLFLIFFLY